MDIMPATPIQKYSYKDNMTKRRGRRDNGGRCEGLKSGEKEEPMRIIII